MKSSLVGPTLGYLEDRPNFSGEWTASDTHRLRKMLPYQNLFYIRQLLDKVEEETNNALGVPQRRKQ